MGQSVPAKTLFVAVILFAAFAMLARAAENTPDVSKNEETPIGTFERIDAFPAAVQLASPRRSQLLVVTGFSTGGQLQDLTQSASFETSDSAVAVVDGNRVVPVGNGTTDAVIQAGTHEIRIPITVTGQNNAGLVGFKYDTVVALTKQGCNGGACHGSPTGKGGFRLSLAGYDPALDARSLIREALGRRTNPLDPDRSLILQKPQMQLAHGGGKRLRPNDPAYETLRTWIAQGCRLDPPGAAECDRIEVYPTERLLRWPAQSQQLVALAHFTDGSARDVTREVVYSSSDEAVAEVTPGGFVQSLDRGETTVVVKYLEHVATARLTFLKDAEGFQWPDPPANNYIDELVFEKLRLLQIPPSPLASDSEFLRRVHLDVIGILPTPEETRAFLSDSNADKRSRLVDQLLKRPEYARFWALRWGDLLQLKGSKVTTSGVHKFYRWLVRAMDDNMPYDEFAHHILTAGGSTFTNPPAGYFRAVASTNECAESTSQLFLGIRIQCAKCHNHPFERWTQDNYYGIGAFFHRVQRKETGRPGEMVVWDARHGEPTKPDSDEPVRAWLPLEGQIDLAEEADRRDVFARWLARADNPLFAKVGVNRIWGYVMGRGVVEPVDDFRDSNPASNSPLLDALAADFVQSGFDQKHMLRTILNSRTYQLASKATESNAADQKYFSHARARMLGAEQLLEAICQVTGVPERFAGLPAGTRATELPSPDVASEFLKVFGQPGRNSACACERTDTPKLTQALQLISGPELAGKLRNRHGRLARQLDDQQGRVLAAGQPPADGLALWLRADAGTLGGAQSLARDGEPVAIWEDQAGHARNVQQIEEQRRPQFIVDGPGGLPTLRFDGQDDLLHNEVDNLVTSGSPRTVLIVGRVSEGKSGGSLFTFRRSTAGGKTVFTAQLGLHGGNFYVYSDGIHSAGNSTIPPAMHDEVREPFIVAFLSPGAGQKLAVHVGGKVQPVSQSGSIGPDDGTAGFTVGNREDVELFPWGGDVSEVLVYDQALSPAQLTAAGSYLAAKYGLETDYPPLPQPHAAPPDTLQLSNAEILTQWYLAALCRMPSDDEIAFAERHIELVGDRREGLEDVCWALLNSQEFLFQH